MKRAKKIMTLIILFIGINPIFPQTVTYKKVFPSTNIGVNQFNISCKPLFSQKSYIISTFGSGITLFITKINSSGDFVSKKRFISAIYYCNLFINDNMTFTFYSNYGYNKELFKLDTSLNVISAIQLDSINCSVNSNVICRTLNNGFLLSGGRELSTPLIVKIDSDENVIWSKYFTPIQGGIQDIVQTQDSGFAIALNLKNAAASLIKTDKNGDVLWAKSYFRPRGYIHNVLENTDGTIIITGNVDSLLLNGNEYNSEYKSSPLFFVKLDNLGNVLWAKTFGDNLTRIRNYPSYTKHTQDGGFITLATLAINDWVDDLILIKTDSNCDTLWIRAHGSIQSDDFGQNIEQLNDKGYIICGGSMNNIPVPYSNLYIVRTDSLGHTDSMCEEYSPSIAVNNITVNDSNINVSSVPFTITTSIPDTSTQNFTTYAYDGCHLDAIPELYAEQTAALLIYPNPTDGAFSIEAIMNTPLKTEIEIYDMNCRRVYKETTTESVTSIDLTGNARGLYFVRMSNERWVKTGKVMVY